MTSGFGTGALASLCVAFVLGVTPTTATAQVSCATSGRAAGTSPVRWQPPLDRLVSIHERGAALRDALDRLAAAAGLRLAYAANASYDLRRTLSFVISAENLLDHQLGEPDNVTALPGRTITGGVRAKF
jgi:hypothetical protein